MQIPNPEGMELAEWANGTAYALGQYTSIMQFFDTTDWREWGVQFYNSPKLGLHDPPNPYEFDNWRLWAERLQGALGNVSGNPKSRS
jgi:hypothetical protein